MTSQALILMPIPFGWAIDLTGGRRVAQFRGPGARARARRYLAQISRRDGADHPPLPEDWSGMC